MTLIVTGGTKGIGLAIADHMAAPGRRQTLVYHSDEAAAAAARAQLEAKGAVVTLVRAVFGLRDEIERIMGEVEVEPGHPTCLVHSAAMIYPTSVLAADPETFTQAMQVNGLSLFHLVQAGLPLFGAGSSIVLVSSAGARTNSANYAALGVGKAMAESLMRYLAPELAPKGIRINAVAPGLVATTSVAGMVGGQDAAERLFDRAARANPSGRIAKDADYAAVVEFLLGPASAFVQGQVIHANGGAYVPG